MRERKGENERKEGRKKCYNEESERVMES